MSITIALLLSMTACEGSGGGGAQQQTEDQDTAIGGGVDNLAPSLEHTEVVSPQSASGYVSITATIFDENAIVNTAIYYRPQTSASWSSLGMTAQGPDVYIGTLGPAEMQSGGMHYYIEAVDQYGNVGTLPDGAPNDYFKFDLVE